MLSTPQNSLAVPIPNQSALPLPTTVPLSTDRSVYRPWKSVSITVQRVSSFTVCCQYPTVLLNSNNKQPLYVLLNCAVRSCENCYCGNVVIILVALVIHRSMRMRHIAICVLPRSRVCFHIIS